jgi:CheY-like chemotaxis protein
MTTALVVDDSPVDRKIIGGIVEEEGLSTTYAEDGRQALEMMAAQKFDIVLTDLQMPVLGGLELVREIRIRYPNTPVILITRLGSEDIAAQALRDGAASYVPKRNLKRDLGSVLEAVLSAVESAQESEHVREIFTDSVSHYVLGYEPNAPKALINHFQKCLNYTNVHSDTEKIRIGTALAEALANAIDHGNLELCSELRESDITLYRKTAAERSKLEPFRDRKVHVTARFLPDQATFVIRDEGPGFDPLCLPDPTDPENLCKPGGRGVMLIRTFMDEVSFNDKGNEITMIKRL